MATEAAIQTLAEHAYAVIKREIIRCELRPGSQITEAYLAETYELGRAAIRNALNRLYQDRLVRPLPRKGYLVAPITLKEVRDLFAVRLLLEPAGARLAAGKVDVEHLLGIDVELREIRKRLELCISEEDFLRKNTEFHVAVARASGNGRLCELIEGLFHEMERLIHFSLTPPATNLESFRTRYERTHYGLIEALSAGDGERAERVTIEEVLNTQTMVVDALVSSPTIQSVSLAFG